MSDAERQKWNQRYAAGAYEALPQPNAYLSTWAPRVAIGPALDVACGAGRNALYLAKLGFAVDGLDISSVGLARADERARRAGVDVNWLEQDLSTDMSLPRTDYQLIVMVHYVAADLLAVLPDHLRPGGYLLVEEHLRWPEPVAGPGSDRFRVASGTLVTSVGDLDVLDTFEGTVTDADGAVSAVARIVAQKPA